MLVIIPFLSPLSWRAVDCRREDAIDILNDLVERLNDGVGLHVAIAPREGEWIEVVCGPSHVVRWKECLDLLEVDEGAGLLECGRDSTADPKSVAVVDGDRMSGPVSATAQVDANSRRIAGGSIVQLVVHFVQAGAVDPPPSLDLFEPEQRRKGEVSMRRLSGARGA